MAGGAKNWGIYKSFAHKKGKKESFENPKNPKKKETLTAIFQKPFNS